MHRGCWIALAAVVGSIAPAGEAGAIATSTSPSRWGDLTNGGRNVSRQRLHTCLWEGPAGMRGVYGTDPATDPRISNQYPDKAAAYWLARISLPAGAELTLHGAFPHARYMSFNSYPPSGEPYSVLTDTAIRPDAGSKNPFLPGADRTVARRSYTVHIVPEAIPADGRTAPNTVYLGAPDGTGHTFGTVNYRVYVADRGADAGGRAGLPRAELHMADGSVATGQALCDATPNPLRGTTRAPAITADAWTQLVNGPGDNPATAPTRWTKDGRFQTFFNIGFSLLGLFLTPEQQAQVDATQRGGFYSDRNNRYMFAALNKTYGRVFTFTARAPVTPRTFAGGGRMPAHYDLRYFSICTEQAPVTGETADCLYDEQVPIDRKGNLTVVVSAPADRPANATNRCGVAWLNWGPGEGFAGGRSAFGLVIFRNQLPSASFHHSVFDVTVPFTDAKVLGPYYPRQSYTTRSAFQRRGCNHPKYLPPSGAHG